MGGSTATGIVATAMLSGRPCAMMGTIGGEIGQFIRRDFIRHNVDVSRLIEVEGQSAIILVMAIASDSSRNFYRKPQTMASLAIEQVDEAMIASANFF